MGEQELSVTHVTIIYDARTTVWKYEPIQTFFFCLDKNYRSREYARTRKVLPLSQIEN